MVCRTRLIVSGDKTWPITLQAVVSKFPSSYREFSGLPIDVCDCSRKFLDVKCTPQRGADIG